MKYTPKQDNVLATITYGSWLYGTSTPESDHDFKSIYLPFYRDMLMGRKLQVNRFRENADGTVLDHNSPMTANGWESEHTPVQNFVQDFLGGQAYAVEFAFAVRHGKHLEHPSILGFEQFEELCEFLTLDCLHQNVIGMVGFAAKQTTDYVDRGARLVRARAVLEQIDSLLDAYSGSASFTPRLDTIVDRAGSTALEFLAKKCDLTMGVTANNNKVLKTLELNGRSYLESTALSHVRVAVEKLVNGYGERSTSAADTKVEWKSLSHAVRVYQQVIELLDTGTITFPRFNASELLNVKRGNVPIEQVRDQLLELREEVDAAQLRTKLPSVNVVRPEANEFMSDWLVAAYA